MVIKPYQQWEDQFELLGLKMASYLNEPLCKTREYFYSMYLVEHMYEGSLTQWMQTAYLITGMVFFAALTPFTAPFALGFRAIISHSASKPFLHIQREGEGKVLPSCREVTVLSHNQCYTPGGYNITDGGVTPTGRIKGNMEKVKELSPDVVCLYEVADVCDAEQISTELPDYPYVIPVAGLKALGPSSMMYVASKYEIDRESIEFVPFVKEKEITGQAQFSEKGYLSFDLKSQGEVFATIISTHLQHSEIPERPEEYEVESREKQLQKIFRHIDAKVEKGRSVIFTGDLNASESEIEAALGRHHTRLTRDSKIIGQMTWGGDAWCANLMEKPVSSPLVLDYTMVAGRAYHIATQILPVGFAEDEFRPNALSDHDLLFSCIKIN